MWRVAPTHAWLELVALLHVALLRYAHLGALTRNRTPDPHLVLVRSWSWHSLDESTSWALWILTCNHDGHHHHLLTSGERRSHSCHSHGVLSTRVWHLSHGTLSHCRTTGVRPSWPHATHGGSHWAWPSLLLLWHDPLIEHHLLSLHSILVAIAVTLSAMWHNAWLEHLWWIHRHLSTTWIGNHETLLHHWLDLLILLVVSCVWRHLALLGRLPRLHLVWVLWFWISSLHMSLRSSLRILHSLHLPLALLHLLVWLRVSMRSLWHHAWILLTLAMLPLLSTSSWNPTLLWSCKCHGLPWHCGAL
mmetsp:Transcript_59466/g.110052  ORF Transcript_59466/g.110052 Transcript_59466/m.110052 type:complete len:304 (-) Transcript_59466:29-940(-)